MLMLTVTNFSLPIVFISFTGTVIHSTSTSTHWYNLSYPCSSFLKDNVNDCKHYHTVDTSLQRNKLLALSKHSGLNLL